MTKPHKKASSTSRARLGEGTMTNHRRRIAIKEINAQRIKKKAGPKPK